ncbi:MAG: von Willebrand factor type A domain-containing protein [Candidatus Poribacteria bacterium]|nr:von Willebrand factor type A domain-containing protein [Candidatus Poribacteria bacterium]
MRIKRLSGALVVSVVCHIVVVIITGFHLVAQDRQFKELLGAEFILFSEAPKPKVRKPVIESVIKSTAPLQNPNAPNTPTANGIMFERPPGLAMVQQVGAARDQTVENRRLSGVKVPKQHPQILMPPNGTVYDDVFFKGAGTNPFIDTEDDAFSTFGMDVDTASYSVMRRYLRDGYLPPPEAVRVEEFVNAFDYNYTPPANEAFAVHLEGAPSKFGEGKRLQLLRIGIQGRVIPDTDRKDAILTFVIDVSGSMARENRLELVKKALTLLLEQLRPNDKVGIVVYGSNARVVLPHTGIVNREHILSAIRALAPEGATNAEAGLRMGYKLALQNSKPDCINRVILCSDGVANVGQTGSDAILKEIRTYVKEGVMLTTVGFGMGNYNDILMEQLANKGNGSYAYVDTLKEAKRVFVENLTGTLQVIAKDAKIQVEFNPETVSRFRLLGYENRRLAHEDFRNDTVDAGEVGAGHSVTALYEIKLHEDANGKLATVSIRHENPDTGNVTEVNRSISTDALKGSFEETTPTFQLAVSVAEFAEILRGSFWAQEGSLEIVRETLEGILPHIHAKTREHSERNEELLSLVRKAQRFKEQKAL